MKEIKAPQKYSKLDKLSIFLSGSIEMGKAIDWQTEVKERLKDKDIILLNPRRDNWDSSWIQSIKNKRFKEQVDWELKAMEDADVIIVNFVAGTKSPITLLELGLFKDKKMFVCCPEGFWKRGNVEIVCQRYNIPFFEDLGNLLKSLKIKLN